jgi:predicted nucleic acid-binding protein
MILVDTGPLVALFDRGDPAHARAASILETIHEPLSTTVPVLTEAFHMLGATGRAGLRDFIVRRGLSVRFLDGALLLRVFALMTEYVKRNMDFADASLVAVAEVVRTRKVFTIDRRDFKAYRIRMGHRLERPIILGD